MALLLVFSALAGALHFLFPVAHVAAVPTKEVAKPITNSDAPTDAAANSTTND